MKLFLQTDEVSPIEQSPDISNGADEVLEWANLEASDKGIKWRHGEIIFKGECDRGLSAHQILVGLAVFIHLWTRNVGEFMSARCADAWIRAYSQIYWHKGWKHIWIQLGFSINPIDPDGTS